MQIKKTEASTSVHHHSNSVKRAVSFDGAELVSIDWQRHNKQIAFALKDGGRTVLANLESGTEKSPKFTLLLEKDTGPGLPVERPIYAKELASLDACLTKLISTTKNDVDRGKLLDAQRSVRAAIAAG